MKVCSDYYKAGEIKVANRILHDFYYKDTDERPRFRVRKRYNMKSANLQDMLNMLSSLEQADKPDVLARNLNNLPPLSLKDFDLSNLLAEMETLTSEVYVMKMILSGYVLIVTR